jgi:hypothetical protein
MQWRDGAKKLIFVVGDAPPSSRGEVPTYDVLAKEAASRGIVINAIRCGWDGETQVAFQRIARLGNGEFSTIQQDGGVQQVATPYDDQIAELSGAIDRTAVIVGDEGVRGATRRGPRRCGPAPAKANRAGYYGKGKSGEGPTRRADADLASRRPGTPMARSRPAAPAEVRAAPSRRRRSSWSGAPATSKAQRGRDKGEARRPVVEGHADGAPACRATKRPRRRLPRWSFDSSADLCYCRRCRLS